MKSNIFKRTISIMLCLLTVMGFAIIPMTVSAAVLPDGYEKDFETQ